MGAAHSVSAGSITPSFISSSISKWSKFMCLSLLSTGDSVLIDFRLRLIQYGALPVVCNPEDRPNWNLNRLWFQLVCVIRIERGLDLDPCPLSRAIRSGSTVSNFIRDSILRLLILSFGAVYRSYLHGGLRAIVLFSSTIHSGPGFGQLRSKFDPAGLPYVRQEMLLPGYSSPLFCCRS